MSRFAKCSLLSVLLVFSILLLSHTGAFAAVTGKISGVVTDAETGEPLPGVNVIVEGTVLGAATSAAPRGGKSLQCMRTSRSDDILHPHPRGAQGGGQQRPLRSRRAPMS